MKKTLSSTEKKSINRFNNAEKLANIFKQFFIIGYTDKKTVHTLLQIHCPKHLNTNITQFSKIWHLKIYDEGVINDLQTVVNKIK